MNSDPWAVPVEPAAGAEALLTELPVQPRPTRLPFWIQRLAARNRPAPADLDKAWRCTLLTLAVSTCGYGLWGVAVARIAAQGHVPPTAVPLIASGSVLASISSYSASRWGWLGRATAVVGTRPDIGYQGFAQLPGVIRLTRYYRAAPVAAVVLLVPGIVLASSATRVGWYLLAIMVVLSAAAFRSVALQRSARRELDALLARPARTPAA